MPVTHISATPAFAAFLAASWNQSGFGSHQQTSEITQQAHTHQSHIYIHIKHIYRYTCIHHQVTHVHMYTAGYKLQVSSLKDTDSEHLE